MSKKSSLMLKVSETKRIKANNYIIDIIIKALKGWEKIGDVTTHISYTDILNKTIRHYIIPSKHWCISEKADKLWKSITNENIEQYGYQQVIPCNKADGSQSAVFYKGNSGEGTRKSIPNERPIRYNEIFIIEHVIPVAEIIKQLKKMPHWTRSNVREILDSMYICRMLKEEDRKITRKSKRGSCFDYILTNIYEPAGIIIKKK